MFRRAFILLALLLLALVALGASYEVQVLWSLVVLGPVLGLGLYDLWQPEHAILRNFPLVGHGRYLLESIRPELQQYFIEIDQQGRPFSREQRTLVYQRAKRELDTLPFGTRLDYYAPGHTWLEHSLAPRHIEGPAPRVTVGAARCDAPYSASLLNISAMSFGALSKRAILSLNGAARDGGFAHNTGEGGISPYHLEPGGDLVWQVGTGYFGCRTPEGAFDPERFEERATLEVVKMVEVKLSQGAKPGKGGILPACKVTAEIAKIRGVPAGRDVLSPPLHGAFDSPRGLLDFVARLRRLSGGKPVGIKLCVGQRRQVLGLVKAMVEAGSMPDFITVDGGEGGTGAAPLEFSNRVGWPLLDALSFVHNALVGAGIRDGLRIIASGRVIDGFDIALRLALGADLCNSARGMMFALGCVQALRCNNDTCPTGVAAQNPSLVAGLVVEDKRERVAAYHRNTLTHFLALIGAAGCASPEELCTALFRERVGPGRAQRLDRLYPVMEPGALVGGTAPEGWREDWDAAATDRF